MTGVVVDTSAALAVLLGEDRSEAVLAVLDDAEPRLLSAATLVELGIVLEARFGAVGAAVLERFLRDAGIDVVPFDRPQADRALDGWRGDGRGRHPAALNLGDCFTYGLAADVGEPLLCVGDDFAQTDIAVVP